MKYLLIAGIATTLTFIILAFSESSSAGAPELRTKVRTALPLPGNESAQPRRSDEAVMQKAEAVLDAVPKDAVPTEELATVEPVSFPLERKDPAVLAAIRPWWKKRAFELQAEIAAKSAQGASKEDVEDLLRAFHEEVESHYDAAAKVSR